jgi:hypothetical protein
MESVTASDRGDQNASSDEFAPTRRRLLIAPVAGLVAAAPLSAKAEWCPLCSSDPPYSTFGFQVATALHETDSTWEMLVGPGRIVWGIKKSRTGTGTTEVHELNPGTGYRTFSLQTGTALPETGNNWTFLVNNSGDIFGVKKNGTASGRTEVYVLSRYYGYRQLMFQGPTALGETDSTWDFALGLNNDLYAIKKSNTGSGFTEVHILFAGTNFLSGYRSFRGHFVTALHPTDSTWAFGVSPARDLYCIKRYNTGTSTTEVHQLWGDWERGRYNQWLLNTGTALHQTDESWDFGVTPDPEQKNVDVYCFKKRNTSSGRTEIHVLKRDTSPRNPGRWLDSIL